MTLSLLSFIISSKAQPDSQTKPLKRTDRYGFWLIPSQAENIYGIALGLFGSESICNKAYTKKSHGLNIQLIGQGFFLTFAVGRFKLDSTFPQNQDSIVAHQGYLRAIHDGIVISTFGTYTNKINGISLSPWMSMNNMINGLSINLLWSVIGNINGVAIATVNMSARVNGVQIGIVNKTRSLRGFQFGIWNINEKRSLPILNWQFK